MRVCSAQVIFQLYQAYFYLCELLLDLHGPIFGAVDLFLFLNTVFLDLLQQRLGFLKLILSSLHITFKGNDLFLRLFFCQFCGFFYLNRCQFCRLESLHRCFRFLKRQFYRGRKFVSLRLEFQSCTIGDPLLFNGTIALFFELLLEKHGFSKRLVARSQVSLSLLNGNVKGFLFCIREFKSFNCCVQLSTRMVTSRSGVQQTPLQTEDMLTENLVLFLQRFRLRLNRFSTQR